MGTFSIIALIMTAIAAIGNMVVNAANQDKQIAHDKEMAEIQKENEKELMNYQTNLTQDTNMISTQKSQAIEAGYSPAMLYGSSLPTASVSGGSSSAGASQLNPLQLFNKLPVDSVVNTMYNSRQQEINKAKIDAEIAESTQRANSYAMQTARDSYDLGLRKRMERTIIDKSLADLEYQRASAENTRFLTERGRQLLPAETQQLNSLNNEIQARVEKITSDIEKNTWEMREIRSNIGRISHLNELTDSQAREVNESVRRSAVGRVMQEFGLTTRLTPAQLRSGSALHQALNNEQMKGAYITLRQLGFSEHEASNAVLYYVASDPKDVTPSVTNAASRIFSAFVLKK